MNYIHTYLTSMNVKVLLSLLATGLVVSILVQVLRHGLPSLDERKKLLTAIAGVLGLVGTLTDWALSASASNPHIFVGKYGGWVLAAVFFAHRFLVSPAYKHFDEGFLANYRAGKELNQQHTIVPVGPAVEVTPAETPTGHEFSL